jgi:uncharacterized membrane protein YbaN (DUF454 family)
MLWQAIIGVILIALGGHSVSFLGVEGFILLNLAIFNRKHKSINYQ